MARGGKESGALHPDPYNEVNNHDPNSPDTDQIYEDYAHRDRWHLSQESADLVSTPNSRSGHGINGGPTPGEPNPAEMSSHGTTMKHSNKG